MKSVYVLYIRTAASVAATLTTTATTYLSPHEPFHSFRPHGFLSRISWNCSPCTENCNHAQQA